MQAGEAPPEPPKATAPKIIAKTDKLKCAAAATGALLIAGTVCAFATLIAPWWLWVGRSIDDFWGVAYKEEAEIPLLTACTADRGGGDPSGATCGLIGSMITFVLISGGVSGGGAILCVAIAIRVNSVCALLIASLLGGGGAAAEGLALLVALDLQSAGLEGGGYYLAFGCIVLDVAACTLAIWGANKATPRRDEIIFGDAEAPEGRLARARKAHQAARELAEALEVRQGFRPRVESPRSGASGSGSPASSVAGGRGRRGKRRRKRVLLQRVIDWGTGENADVPLPIDLLEAAFGEIDCDYSGSITPEELAEALGECGLFPSMVALERIMSDIDANSSGDIDVHEFIAFFQATQELTMLERKGEARAQLLSMICVLLFFGTTVGWAIVGMSRGPENAQLFTMLSGCLAVLFVINVGVPMLQMTLGPSLDAWCAIVVFKFREFKNRKKRRAEQEEAERKRTEELARRADELEQASQGGSPTAASQEGSPKAAPPAALGDGTPTTPAAPPAALGDGASPAPPDVLALPAPGEAGASTARSSGSASPQQGRRRSVTSQASSAASGAMSAWAEEEEDPGDVPGVYLVLHDGTAVRSGISILSDRLRILKRGEQVRIVEVFEHKKQGRLRGRLEAQEGQPARSWITLVSTEDGYRYAKRTAPLQQTRASFAQRRSSTTGKSMSTVGARRTSVSSMASKGGGSQFAARRISVQSMSSMASSIAAESATSGAPPYDPGLYEETWELSQQRRTEACFIGTSQVKDIRLYQTDQQLFPQQKFTAGGTATARGEWRIGLNDK